MKTRRNFISATGLVLAGFAIEGLQAQTAVPSRAEQDVFSVISKYGSPQAVSRTSGSLETISIKVRILSHDAFSNVFLDQKGLPFGNIHAGGNTMRFKHNGIDFLLENFT